MRRLALLPLLLTLSLPATAAPEMYSDAQLDADAERYAQRFAYLIDEALWPVMSADEQQALHGVVIRHPLRGASPLAVKSLVFEGTPTVRAPVSSLKFIEDLSIVFAWRYVNGYSLEPIDEYLALLGRRAGESASGVALPEPLTALGVPPGVLERDPQVDDLSLRFRNTAWAFILAHELGHLRFGHTEAAVSPAEMQRQEEEADAFATELLGRSDTIPMGMMLWLQATAGFMSNRADFASDAAYAEWLRSEATHPVNGRRMRNLAALMRVQAAAEPDSDRGEVLEYIAVRLAAIGEIVEDPEMQQMLARCAESRSPDELGRLGDLPCP